MSASRASSNTAQGNSFYINIGPVVNGTNTFNKDGAGVAVVGFPSSGTLTAGLLIVRDMGSTVRVPATSAGTGTRQRVLRKFQRVDANAASTASWPVTNGFVGFNDGVGGAFSDNVAGAETFYIEVAPTGTTLPLFARLGF